MTRIGFTGSRGPRNSGMTPAQLAVLAGILAPRGPSDELHGGCCVGADAQAMRLAKSIGIRVIAHPGRSAHDAPGGPRPDRDQSSIDHADEIRPELTHFARNRAIVEASDILVAAPSYPGPITRETKGGTAMTYWTAVKAGKQVIVIWPDGSVDEVPCGGGQDAK